MPCSLPCMCIVCDSIHQELKLFSQVKLKEYRVRRRGGDGGEGRKESEGRKGKKKPDASQQSPRSAWPGPVTSGSSLDSLGECSPLFARWPLGRISSSAHTWAASTLLPALGQRAGAYFKFVVLAIDLSVHLDDPAPYGFFYLSPGSRLPTGPFSTFISALWGMWPFLLSLCTFQSSWEARTIHHLTSELFTYLPSRCCCMNMCHLIMAMNKVSPSMPRGCSSNDNVFELSFFYPKVSHCLLP